MSEWIEWVPIRQPDATKGKSVEYKLRNGFVDIELADILDWDHCGDNFDIVAYRVVA